MLPLYDEWHNTVSTDFMRNAKCRGMDVNTFFIAKGKPAKPVTLICNGRINMRGKVLEPPCPVRDECLEYALSLPTRCMGIWGGTTHHERQRIRIDRGLSPD